MFHARFTTQGSTKNNFNNHPIVRDGIILTHNGVITNDDLPFQEFGKSRIGEVDTESLNVALRYGGIEWLCENLLGAYSIAWVDTTKSNQDIHLLTNGNNPLVIGRTVNGNVVWASCPRHFDHLDLESMFRAKPFKQYTIKSDGFIESKWILTQMDKWADTSDRNYYGGAIQPKSISRTVTPLKMKGSNKIKVVKPRQLTLPLISSHPKMKEAKEKLENLFGGTWEFCATQNEWREI